MIEELVLLPRPQRTYRLEGTYHLQPDRFVWLEGDNPGSLLRVGQAVRDALATVGPRWEVTAARGQNPGRLGAVVHVDPLQVPQSEGYHLTILPDQVRIVAHDEAGAFYVAMTLRQVARQVTGSRELPCLRIEDWPDFPHRGLHLDISRDRVPTMETIYSLVDMLAEWKINQLQLYTEHTFAYRNHREVWDGWSPVTGEEVLALDAYCRERHIELVPNQNSFGHLAKWLVHPRYRHLSERPEDPFLPGFGVYGTLSPVDPGSIPFLAELYDELLPHFSSRQFHVGCDEARIGGSRSKEICEQRGRGRVYLEFVLKIYDLVQRRGHTMQMWGDLIAHHPEVATEVPEGIIALMESYNSDDPLSEWVKVASNAGIPFYVSPGTNTWNSIAGRTDNAISNMWNAAENGLTYGAIGYLNTDWGDNGHWQHLPISFVGFAYGAAVSWAAKANKDIDLPRALDLHAFLDSAGVMGRLAYDLGNAYKQTGVEWRNESPLSWILVRHPGIDPHLAELTEEGLARAEAYVDGVMSQLPEARMARPDAELIADEFRNAAGLLRHACHMWTARIRVMGREVQPVPEEVIRSPQNSWPNRPSDGEIASAPIPTETRKALTREMGEIISEYRRLWLTRNRPGGLESSTARFKKLLAEYRAK